MLKRRKSSSIFSIFFCKPVAKRAFPMYNKFR